MCPTSVPLPRTTKSVSKRTLPVPLGSISTFAFDVETILLPSTSKSPPNCGVESAATDVNPPAELTRLFGVSFLKTPALASTINRTSLSPSTSPDARLVLLVIRVVVA